MIDVKAHLHQHDKVLDDKIDDFKQRLGNMDGQADALRQENEHIQKYLESSQSAQELTAETVLDMVKPSNALSEKLI